MTRIAHLRTLGRYLGEHRYEAIAALLAMGGVVAALVLVPRWAAALVGTIIPARDLPRLARHLALGIALVGALAVFAFARDFVLMRLSARFAARVREAMLATVLRRPYAAARERLAIEMPSRVSSDITLLHRSLVDGLAVFAPNLLTVVALLAAMVTASWRLSLGAVLLALPMLLVVESFWKRLDTAIGVSQSRLAAMTAFVVDCLDGTRETKAFGREAFLERRFRALSARTLASHLREERMASMHPSTVMLVGVAGLVGLIFLSAWLSMRGVLDTTHLVRFLVLLGLLVGPLQETTRSSSALTRLFAVMDRCQEVIDAPVEDDPPHAPALPTVRGAITFDAIVVRYPSTGFELGPISLAIEAGETVAIVGASGAGKSTLLDLVPRFIEPTSGRILVDGMPVAARRRDSLRAQIGVLSQEPFLFPGTLAENLRFGKLDATDAELHAAARAAHVEEFVSRLPLGYDTVLDRRGGNLSVGQRQRIALARVILKDPPILLLDEPTSALDVESERLLQDSLRRACAGRTTIIVTHRPSLVANATRVVVLAGGRVVDEGAPAEILERHGMLAAPVDSPAALEGSSRR